MARPRWVLHLQAQTWRFLMSIGMYLHRLASPRPPKPSFSRTVRSTVSDVPGAFDVFFYVPPDYNIQRKLGFKKVRGGRGYPVVINFHGGGFTLGTSRDDSRWCGTVVSECNAVVMSVEYRLAPECPFPTAVDDGADAVLWIAANHEELGIDKNKIAISGFSSGGNMAFTVPLRLYDYLTDYARPLDRREGRQVLSRTISSMSQLNPSSEPSAASSSTSVGPNPATLQGAGEYNLSVPSTSKASHAPNKKTPDAKVKEGPSVSLCAIVPWYPSTDYTRTREQRRSTTLRKDQDLPALFTDLFDESYLHPPDSIPLDSPYLSPGIAASSHLKAALPQDIIMHTCEWDMLLAEGQEFHQRLIGPEIGKAVVYELIEGVPHGWDKAPNPIKPTPGVKEHYLKACKELRRVFNDDSSPEDLEFRRRQSVPLIR